MTPLEKIIRDIIAVEGPLRLDRYMGLCLGHPEHGYYMAREPFGEEGDFITAPEISQVFGELIGIWCIGVWQAMGKPEPFNLVELGPGRGVLMADILRASKVVPGFPEAAQVQFVETSPKLRAEQRERLGGNASWHESLHTVPECPMILVANEFFDAIPIRQLERRGGRWLERVVGLAGNKLAVGLVDSNADMAGMEGEVREFDPARRDIAEEIGQRLSRQKGAALVIDYGHLKSAPGDTLQAVRRHQRAEIADSPGECDLTSHVDFEALGSALQKGGAAVWPAVTQREFLLAMGLEARTAALSAKADAAEQEKLQRAMTRLADAAQMGNLFKVLAATSRGLPAPYPFGPR